MAARQPGLAWTSGTLLCMVRERAVDYLRCKDAARQIPQTADRCNHRMFGAQRTFTATHLAARRWLAHRASVWPRRLALAVLLRGYSSRIDADRTPRIEGACIECSVGLALRWRRRGHSRIMWALADVVGLFSNNECPFSRNVGRRHRIFSANVVPNRPMLSGGLVYVLRSLHIAIKRYICRYAARECCAWLENLRRLGVSARCSKSGAQFFR